MIATLIKTLIKSLIRIYQSFQIVWWLEKGVFMRPYYLTTNNYGYYIVSFVNQETGKKTTYKSTHTKDYNQAITTVMKWYTEGVPTDNAITLKRRGLNAKKKLNVK